MDFKDLTEKIYKNKEEEIIKKSIEDLDKTDINKQSIKKILKKIYDSFKDPNYVFSRFPIEIYSEEIKLKIIEYVFNKIECSGQRQIVDNINRKIFHTGKETNLNIDYKKFYSFNDDESCNIGNIYLNEMYNYRTFIRKNYDIVDTINKVVDNNSKICEEIIFENNMLKSIGLGKVRADVLKEVEGYVMLVSDSWMQILTYLIITNKNILNKNDIIGELLTLQGNMIRRLKEVEKENIDRYLKIQFNKSDKDFMFNDAIDKFDIFVVWIEQSSYNAEYVKILEVLEEEMKENPNMFKSIKKRYETTKHMRISDKNKLKDIVCEGENIYKYNEKIEETKRAINIFKKYGGRDVDEKNVQDLKVFFREIYMNDNKYSQRSKKAMTIMRDYYVKLDLKGIEIEVFEKNLDYIFIREKINRGFYRENDLIAMYMLKNEIQKSAINLFLELYMLYDEELIVKWSKKLNIILFSNLLRILKEKTKFLR